MINAKDARKLTSAEEHKYWNNKLNIIESNILQSAENRQYYITIDEPLPPFFKWYLRRKGYQVTKFHNEIQIRW